MSSKSIGFRWHLAAWLFAAFSDCGFAQAPSAIGCTIPPPIAVGVLLHPIPIEATGTATWNKLAIEAEAEFAANNYDAAVLKIRELLAASGDADKNAPYEKLYYKIGLANLLSYRMPEAEAAFNDCIKRFPKGEFTSRSFLGLGRACMWEGDPEVKWRAVAALKTAAKDPQCRPEAILWLGEVYADFGKTDEALAVYRNFMGTEIRTPQQAAAAVAELRLLADLGRMDELVVRLAGLARHAGVRNDIAWFANQAVVLGDELFVSKAYEPALAMYRWVPSRGEILEIQASALGRMRRNLTILESRAKAEEIKPMIRRSITPFLVSDLRSAVGQAESCMKAIEEKTDLDAALLMRRGRCLFYLERHEEALLCFRTIRTKFPTATDAENAAYAEIVILNKRKENNEIKDKCNHFLLKFPHSDNVEQVATWAGEVFVQSGDWKYVGTFYRDLEKKFPQSVNLDRFIFFQGLAFFQEADFAQSTPLFERLLKDFPKSALVENASYYLVMSNFLNNQYQETLNALAEHLKKFPDGRHAGDMIHRVAFIEFNDGKADQSDKIIRDLSLFLAEHPDDPANGSMYCLMADTYKRIRKQNEALESYIKALWTDSADDVLQYAIDSATDILQERKDWAGIAKLHGDFIKGRPDNKLAVMAVRWVAKMKAREGKREEAVDMIAEALKTCIADPSSEQAELIIDELAKALVPRKNPHNIDADALDKQLVEILNKCIGGMANPTTAARVSYARARLARLLRRNDLSDNFLKEAATANAKDPSALSPVLLEVCGEVLLKSRELDAAEAMYQRLKDHFPEAACGDAGLVGLGRVALDRKQPAKALDIFEKALMKPENNRFNEATLGKLEALVELGQLEAAEKLALQIVGDREFRGELAAKAYLQLARVYRKQAAQSEDEKGRDLLKNAHAYCQRVYVAYQAYPELCAEGYWQAAEIAGDLGEEKLRQDTLKALLEHPKLKNTKAFKKAMQLK